ncbi:MULTISPECIES: hypothetical protein [Mesorhizobium]|nr:MULTISPECIES: hypothetical protein [Mesorhizobium]MCF6119857.1 hypothetical protein [Mesorhizobium muleiense]
MTEKIAGIILAVEFPMLTSDHHTPFFNINTSDDLARAEGLLQSMKP